jgi:hypothetical protein
VALTPHETLRVDFKEPRFRRRQVVFAAQIVAGERLQMAI